MYTRHSMNIKIALHSIVLFVLVMTCPAVAEELVGYYIGSFDPPTLGHKLVVAAAMKAHPLAKVYITVNHNTDKDFNTSMDERLQMMKKLFSEYGDRVEVLREPLEGRPAFARYLLEKHQGKILGIFGDDTFEKNYKIFTTDADVHDFDYVKVARPEATALESVYVPVVHDLEIDADGTSSSAARDLIALGKDPVAAKILSKEVYDYIQELKLYQKISGEKLADAQKDFLGRYNAFISTLKQQRPDLDLSKIAEPTFKATQSLGAQKDKFVRHIVTSLKMPLEAQLVFRPEAEKILQIPFQTRPLRSAKAAGIYIGSFDGPNRSQRDVIAETLKQQNLDVLYVGVLGTSRKPIHASLAERMNMMKALTAEFGDKVRVLSIPNLEGSQRTFRRLRNEHSAPTLAVFGSNVFDPNFDRLKKIPGLRFGIIPLPGDQRTTPLPPGVAVIKIPTRLPGENTAGGPSVLADCQGVLIDVGGTFQVHLPGSH